MSNNRATLGGNVFKSDGSIHNWADCASIRDQFCLLNQTVNNGASILSIRLENLAAQTDHYFTLDIPDGKTLSLFSREIILSEGRYFIDAVAVDSIDTTGGTEGITAPLNKTSAAVVQTKVIHTVGNAVNPVVREFGFIDTGSAMGAARVSGASGAQGVFKLLSGKSPLRVRKTNTDTFTLNLVFIAWEFEQ